MVSKTRRDAQRGRWKRTGGGGRWRWWFEKETYVGGKEERHHCGEKMTERTTMRERVDERQLMRWHFLEYYFIGFIADLAP